jgi:hypothetical protein
MSIQSFWNRVIASAAAAVVCGLAIGLFPLGFYFGGVVFFLTIACIAMIWR